MKVRQREIEASRPDGVTMNLFSGLKLSES